MANTNLPPIIVKHFSIGIASSGKCYINLLIIYYYLLLTKAKWMWNASYQALFDKAKLIIKEDACMKFYEMRLLYMA